jgi:hypothetical protein
MTQDFARFAGWAALASGAAAIVAFAAIAIFFAGVKPFGPVNDIALVVTALTMAPLALAFHQLGQDRGPALSLAALILGLAGMLVFAGNNTLMILGVTRITSYDKVADPVLAINLAGFAGIGLWMIAAGLIANPVGILPAGLTWLGLASGAGFAVMALAFWRLGGFHPVTMAAGLIWQIGYPIWAIWLGRVLLSGR